MPAKVTLSLKELDELIEKTEAQGGDAAELKKLRAEFPTTRPRQPARRETWLVAEEETTEERLNREAGDLFLGGFSADVLGTCIEYDSKHSLGELRAMCLEASLSPSGHKKLLAAKLIAHQWEAEGKRKVA